MVGLGWALPRPLWSNLWRRGWPGQEPGTLPGISKLLPLPSPTHLLFPSPRS